MLSNETVCSILVGVAEWHGLTVIKTDFQIDLKGILFIKKESFNLKSNSRKDKQETQWATSRTIERLALYGRSKDIVPYSPSVD